MCYICYDMSDGIKDHDCDHFEDYNEMFKKLPLFFSVNVTDFRLQTL